MKPATVFVSVTGPDEPGIFSAITGVLRQHPVVVRDLTCNVGHGTVVISLILEMSDSAERTGLLESLRAETARLRLRMEYRLADAETSVAAEPRFHYAVTLIGAAIGVALLDDLAKVLSASGANIEEIRRLSDKGFQCFEIRLSSPVVLNRKRLQGELLQVAAENQVDIALQEEGLFRRAKRMVVLDMDSTLIQAEVVDELAREKGVYDEVAGITASAMAGKLSFDESLIRRCAKLQGLTLADLDRVYSRIQLSTGAEDLFRVLKKLGYKTALLTGGFTFVAERLQKRLGIDHVYANRLDIEDGKLTGRVLPPIINAERKAELLQKIAEQEGIPLDQVIAIGDGANDVLMLEAAGLGIAFHGKAVVRERADFALSQTSLRAVLYLLGLSSADLTDAGLEV